MVRQRTPSFIQRVLRIEPGISLAQWSYDRIIGNWPALLGILGSAGILSAFARLTDWLTAWGPIVYPVAALGGALAAVCIGYYWNLMAAWRQMIGFREVAFAATGSVNPVQTDFSRERIRLTDFVLPGSNVIRGKHFANCEIVGPANVAIVGNPNTLQCSYSGCDGVVMPTGLPGEALQNCIILVECSFRQCSFHRITFMVSERNYQPTFGIRWISLTPQSRTVPFSQEAQEEPSNG